MSLHDQSQASRRTAPGLLAVALAACSTFTSGCAPFAEKLSALCTTAPPVYGDEMPPPADFGHYPTHWDRWPCNELTIDRGHLPKDKPAKKPTDPGSTPGDTTGAENEMGNEGVPGRREDPNALPDDLFEPDRNAPLPNQTPDETPPLTPDEPGLAPPDSIMPDATPPDAAPTDAIPEVKPPAAAPDIPEDLFKDEKPGGVPPGHGSLGTDPLPLDAPQGDLVSDGADSSRQQVTAAKKPNATSTGPTIGPAISPAPRPIESARRPSAIRRTSAIEPLPAAKRDVFAEDAADESDGPELLAPAMNRPETVAPKAAPSHRSGAAKASATTKSVAAPAQWPEDDEVPAIAPLPSDTRGQNGSAKDRWVRTSNSQKGSAARASQNRGAVATDGQ